MRPGVQQFKARDGQAIVEFIVGLVAVLVLFAGLLQVASLAKTHTDTMVEARRLADAWLQGQAAASEIYEPLAAAG